MWLLELVNLIIMKIIYFNLCNYSVYRIVLDVKAINENDFKKIIMNKTICKI